MSGNAIKVGPLMATQMACAETAAMDQESRYRAAIEANMADDFRQIDGGGNLETKASFMDGGRTRMTGRHQDKPFTSHYRYIDVYVRRSDKWKIVSVQITRIP